MGLYLTPGHTYSDTSPNNVVNGANLNEHVSEAIIKPTAISSQTLKDPAALADEVLINDGGSLKKVTMQQLYALFIQPGTVIQTAYAEYTANTNLTTVIPPDDTIPQNTEGTEILSASITPRFSTSTILVTFRGYYSLSVSVQGISALFRDSVASAISAEFGSVVPISGNIGQFSLCFMDSPSTTSSTTYKIRVGPQSAATLRLNGTNTVRFFGGSSRATLVVQEIKV